MPYKKQNAKIMYINKCSSQQKSIIKQIQNIFSHRSNKKLKQQRKLFNDIKQLRIKNEIMRLQ